MANSQVAYINQTIPVPHVKEMENKPEYIGSGQRTILGTYRYDSITIKDNYSLEAEYLTPDEFNAIYDHLKSINGGITQIWLDSFGGDSTSDSEYAHVILKNEKRVQFGRNGVWYSNGRSIELEIIMV